MTALLLWIGKHWKLVVWLVSTGGLLLALTVQKAETRHWKKIAAADETALTSLAHTYREASEKARADAEAAARTKEQQNVKLKEEADNALYDRNRIAASNARLAEWVRQHPANQDSPGRGGVPGSTAVATLPDGPGSVAAVDAGTLAICTANTERLLNAKAWGEAFTR